MDPHARCLYCIRFHILCEELEGQFRAGHGLRVGKGRKMRFWGLSGIPVVSSTVLPRVGRNNCHSRRNDPAPVVSSWACEFSRSPIWSLSPSRTTEGHSLSSVLVRSETLVENYCVPLSAEKRTGARLTFKRIVRLELNYHPVRLVRKPDSVLHGQRSGLGQYIVIGAHLNQPMIILCGMKLLTI